MYFISSGFQSLCRICYKEDEELWGRRDYIDGRKISKLRFADVIAILANSSEELVELLSRLEQESNRIGLRINKSKTKIMIVANLNNANLRNIGEFEVRSSFTWAPLLLTET